MNKITNIVKSRLIDKDSLGEWYKVRLSKCLPCTHNSQNKEKLNKVDIFWKIANIGKAHCTLCGCGVENKAKITTESCPARPPLWEAIEDTQTLKDNKIVSLSSKVVLSYEGASKYTFDYGKIKYLSDTDIEFIFLTPNILREFEVRPTCGCTVTKNVKVDGGYKVSINYDSKRLGVFNKTISIVYNRDGGRVVNKIGIKGEVLK